MSIEFKPITIGNINEALIIYNWYVLNSTTTFHLEEIAQEELERMLSVGHPTYQSYLILFKGEVCGFCYLSQFRYKEAYDKSAEITLYLKQDFVAKGIGKATLSYLEKIAKENEIDNLIAVITAENTASIILFEKTNYFKVGHLKNIGVKFGKALDVVSYQKEI
ncbi:MAG: N-acetyltransferase family protein [Flavobacteriales bacterium]|nr:N-acetyltransferase family protein [Flavobacteriales bacterium]